MLILLGLAAAFTPLQAIDSDSWLASGDYPAGDRRKNKEQGDTDYRLTVSPSGSPIACEIVVSSKVKDLDSLACRLLMKRGKFHPARDEQGQAMFGVYTNRVRWFYPSGDVPKRYLRADVVLLVKSLPKGMTSPVTIGLAFMVEPSGEMSNCAASQHQQMLGQIACEQAKLRLRATAALNEAGVSVRSVQNASVVFAIDPATGK